VVGHGNENSRAHFGAGVAPNTPVSQFDCNWTANDDQIWNIVPTRTVNGTQMYKFVNVKSNLCLDLPNYGSNPAGTRVSRNGSRHSGPACRPGIQDSASAKRRSASARGGRDPCLTVVRPSSSLRRHTVSDSPRSAMMGA
jgi:hypothetical protein